MELVNLTRKMIVVIGITALIFIAISAIYYRSLEFLPFALGAGLGAGLNMLKVLMLKWTVSKAVEMSEKDSGNFVRLQYVLRYVLTGGLLALAALTSFISLWGAVAGIFTLPVATFSMKRFLGQDVKAQ